METNKTHTEQLTQVAVMQSVLISENDFRIGNLFFGNYETEEDEKIHSVVCKILGYDPFNSFYWVENKEGIEEFSSFQKIPLTEEWLLNFGFENKYGSYVLSTLRGTIQIEEDLAEISSVITHNGFMSPCEYVHQLQNLYFALTGDELTVA